MAGNKLSYFRDDKYSRKKIHVYFEPAQHLSVCNNEWVVYIRVLYLLFVYLGH